MEKALEALKAKGLDVKCEDLGECLVCYYRKGKEIYVITLSKGKAFFSKIVPFSKAPPNLTCEALYMIPHGLYAFGFSPSELAEKVRSKLEVLAFLSD